MINLNYCLLRVFKRTKETTLLLSKLRFDNIRILKEECLFGSNYIRFSIENITIVESSRSRRSNGDHKAIRHKIKAVFEHRKDVTIHTTSRVSSRTT